MATYKEIQAYIKEQNGTIIKTCWIAHVKEINGLIKQNLNRKYPCPNNKIQIIEDAFKNFGMI